MSRIHLSGDARTEAQKRADRNGSRTGRPPRHGAYGTPTHQSWRSMWNRAKGFSRGRHEPVYRHVTVTLDWLHYEDFLADMGKRPPGTTLDRKDNRFGYSKDNCRWATVSEQNHNRRSKGGRKPRRK